MNKTHFCTLLIIILTSIFSQAQNKSDAINLYTRIDTYLAKGVKNGFSGAIAVMIQGKTIINKGYGIANKNTNTLNNPNTIFDIGSNTKQFTATAILKLAELKKLKLTDSLSKYFKNLPKEKQSITIHQLLTHSAGFVDAIGRDFTKISQKDFFEKLFASKLLSKPGEKYAYSNTGYSILGRIIEIVSNQPYETFLNKYLFKPAGMYQTGYLLPTWNKTQISRSYNRGIIDSESSIFRYQKHNKVNWHLKANGGINSTQNDMLRWFKALKTNKILSKESIKKLTTPYAHFLSGKYHYAYAYGWTVRMLENDIKRLTHNGSNGAYAHSLIWFPEKDIQIVYVTNANSAKVEFLAYDIAKIILDKKYTPQPIVKNVYAFAMDYIKQHPKENSNELIALLKEKYSEDFNSRLLNTIGNLLVRSTKNLDWAIVLFQKNIELHPKNGNLWDSLGDAYKATKQKEKAIESYQKAVEYGHVNSQKKLEDLRKD